MTFWNRKPDEPDHWYKKPETPKDKYEELCEIIQNLEVNHNGPVEKVIKRIIYYYSIRYIMSKYHTMCPRCKVKFLNPWQECDDCISKYYPETQTTFSIFFLALKNDFSPYISVAMAVSLFCFQA